MIAELGQVALAIALLAALAMGIFPLWGAWKGNAALMAVGQRGALVHFGMVFLAFALLTWAFIIQDFSVEYVARHSNSRLPMAVTVESMTASSVCSSPPDRLRSISRLRRVAASRMTLSARFS